MSQRVKIVIWDNIGNTLLGVRPWASWPPAIKEWLLTENPNGEQSAPDLGALLGDFEVELEWWLADPEAQGHFGGLARDFLSSTRKLERIEQLVATMGDADFVVIHKETLPPEAVAGATKLKLLQHLGLDHRGVPLAACRAKGIPVAATPLVNYIAVAEHVWALVLNWAKQLPQMRVHMIESGVGPNWGLVPGVKLVRSLTLGLLGFGEIARPIARVARAFDVPVVYWDVRRFPDLERRYGVEYVEWDEIFRRSDVLSVQLALNEQTRGIIGAREIALMKPTALFVNTARGKLVDQKALTAALEAGRLGGAALDVFDEEPLPADDPLRALAALPGSNVTITPHIAWQSPWTWVTDSRVLWDNVLHTLRDQPIEYSL